MAKLLTKLNRDLTDFIHRQHVFFVATAPDEGRVNLSPKGMDSLRVVAPDRILWLNLTGSGNETAAHTRQNGRITLMWCAFAGPPLILRAYGTARAVHPGEPDFAELADQLPEQPGTRQVFDVRVENVQTSCGYAVPFMDYREERTRLNDWAAEQTPAQMNAYRLKKNSVSIDGLPTGLQIND